MITEIQFILDLILLQCYRFFSEIQMDYSGPPSGNELDDEGDDNELDQDTIAIVIPVRGRSKSVSEME